MMGTIQEDDLQAIAVIGMAGRFPDADNIEIFWQNLVASHEAVRQFDKIELTKLGVPIQALDDPNYISAGVTLDNIDMFDAEFFGLSPREAELMDPQQRFLLECAYETFEHAGYAPAECKKVAGVYVGADISSYFLHNLLPARNIINNQNELQLTYSNTAIATQIAYHLNLQGPCLDINTACSTSLVAIHMACRVLLCYECDMMLAGGASIDARPKKGYWYHQGGILSPDGHCRAFDEKAQGTIAGQGVGLILLKRLEDAYADKDMIYAIIRGSAVNNDGARKVGYTAPSVQGQAGVIRQALSAANVGPESISYIECHGTATSLGDPIEIAALAEVFPCGLKANPAYIGSVKTNIGHLNSAAGVAGVIKTIQALRYQQLPPSLNFHRPNPNIDFASTCLQVSDQLRPWTTTGDLPRRAGVSSFGIGGTNAHIIMEEAGSLPTGVSKRNCYLLTLAAKNPQALSLQKADLAQYLKTTTNDNLVDIAFTLNTGRAAFESRYALICKNREEAMKGLTAAALPSHQPAHAARRSSSIPQVAMLFPGQGVQYVNMAKSLYQTEPVFLQALQDCANQLKDITGLDIIDTLYPSPENPATATASIQNTRLAQPIIFAVEYALSCLWLDWGIQPRFLCGHSLGEYVAACLAGTFDLADALWLVAKRSELMAELDPGAMLAVSLPEGQIKKFLNADCCLAAVNAPNSCVLSGTITAIENVEQALSSTVKTSRLSVSHAFHSHSMESIIGKYRQLFKNIKCRAPKIPIISSMTGDWLTATEAQDPNYWAQQLRQPVQFAQAINKLLNLPNIIYLEVGPSNTLQTLLNLNASQPGKVFGSCPPSHAKLTDNEWIIRSLGKLWERGVAINWGNFYRYEQCHRVPLPTYPFQRKRYWIEPNHLTDPKESSVHERPADLSTAFVPPSDPLTQQIAEIWCELLGIKEVGINDNFFDLGGHSLLATQILSRIYDQYHIDLSLSNFFSNPTIAGMTEVLVKQQFNGISAGQLNNLLVEIEHNVNP